MSCLVGSRVERKEDTRFLQGKGRYTADINIANQTYAVFVRSPHARAKIKSVDTSKALKSSGVVGVLTGKEIAEDKIGGLIAGWAIRSEDGSEMKVPANPPLAKDVANFVGEPVAVVFAETLDEAKEGAEKVKVDYKVLKAVVDPAEAMKSDAIHDGVDKNLCYDWLLGDRKAVDEAFAKADKIIKVDLINNRLVPNAMEPRACVVDYNTASEEITLYTTSQNPHLSRLVMSAFGGVAPENKLRVVAPDVGGGFGSKINVYNEEIVCSWASKKIERPIKWVAERTESFLTDTHGRDHVTHAELAVTNDGKFLGFKNETIVPGVTITSQIREEIDSSALDSVRCDSIAQLIYDEPSAVCEAIGCPSKAEYQVQINHNIGFSYPDRCDQINESFLYAFIEVKHSWGQPNADGNSREILSVQYSLSLESDVYPSPPVDFLGGEVKEVDHQNVYEFIKSLFVEMDEAAIAVYALILKKNEFLNLARTTFDAVSYTHLTLPTKRIV